VVRTSMPNPPVESPFPEALPVSYAGLIPTIAYGLIYLPIFRAAVW
jgi:hypothetical protein